ncbi:MAG TPA: hypothetical protein VLV50_17475 [Stellaceae bacterium]|nr:hypothetical protein [Stellaceae bacterium]
MVKERWMRAGYEPSLWETLADPIVLSLMRADGIARKDVLSAVTDALSGREPTPDPRVRERLGVAEWAG